MSYTVVKWKMGWLRGLFELSMMAADMATFWRGGVLILPKIRSN